VLLVVVLLHLSVPWPDPAKGGSATATTDVGLACDEAIVLLGRHQDDAAVAPIERILASPLHLTYNTNAPNDLSPVACGLLGKFLRQRSRALARAGDDRGARRMTWYSDRLSAAACRHASAADAVCFAAFLREGDHTAARLAHLTLIPTRRIEEEGVAHRARKHKQVR
jgi:hypothetical protein